MPGSARNNRSRPPGQAANSKSWSAAPPRSGSTRRRTALIDAEAACSPIWPAAPHCRRCFACARRGGTNGAFRLIAMPWTTRHSATELSKRIGSAGGAGRSSSRAGSSVHLPEGRAEEADTPARGASVERRWAVCGRASQDLRLLRTDRWCRRHPPKTRLSGGERCIGVDGASLGRKPVATWNDRRARRRARVKSAV